MGSECVRDDRGGGTAVSWFKAVFGQVISCSAQQLSLLMLMAVDIGVESGEPAISYLYG